MRIGIDARLIDETGVGRYIRNLVNELEGVDRKNEYVIFLRSNSFDSFSLPSKRWKKVISDIGWHTVREQLTMPIIFDAEHLDILHVPYYNPPVFYRGPIVVTIHDLTILHFATGKATTLPFPLYELKRFGYWAVLSIALRRANIIAVSETTKQEIIDHFHINPSHITVTYEGVDSKLEKQAEADKALIDGQYFLYVGNAYPHKNVETLITAFDAISTSQKLVLVGADDFFYRRVRLKAATVRRRDDIVFFGPANDKQLSNLYENATALLFPSLMEGFGLPGVEALSYGCPVIASDIPIFHEILKNQAIYFDPNNEQDLAHKLSRMVTGRNTREFALKKERIAYAKKFSWKRMAIETLEVYERSARV